jgi:hypothetical protein
MLQSLTYQIICDVANVKIISQSLVSYSDDAFLVNEMLVAFTKDRALKYPNTEKENHCFSGAHERLILWHVATVKQLDTTLQKSCRLSSAAVDDFISHIFKLSHC